MAPNTQIEPAEALSDNIMGDLIDSFTTGVLATIIVNFAFGKGFSYKNLMKKDIYLDGAKNGAAIALYRRVGRPIINNAMERGGLDQIKL